MDLELPYEMFFKVEKNLNKEPPKLHPFVGSYIVPIDTSQFKHLKNTKEID
tara:strand:- start:1576 stop:1728 length:153 start_codon:yes stop_codon:yes gene_type:complete